VDVRLHAFLTLTLSGGDWLASRLGRFISEEMLPLPVGYEAEWAPETMWTQ